MSEEMLYILIWDSCTGNYRENLQNHIFRNMQKKKKWQIHHLFQKKHDQKELYSTIVAVVEVVALFKDCFEQTSKWSLDVCKWFF